MTMTPNRHVRIEDDVWRAAQARAEREGVTISSRIREWVTAYARGEDKTPG